MKKLFVLFLLSMFHWVEAQCFINGKSTIYVSQEESFTVDQLAQCKECYQWSVSSTNDATIVSDYKTNEVKVKGLRVGRVTLTLSMLTNNGLVQCNKSIDVIEGNSVAGTSSTTKILNCDIDINDFKELRYADNQIIFVPNDSSKNLTYQWVVRYQQGDEKRFEGRVPNVDYSVANPINEVRLIINSTVCTRKFSKTYPESFWKVLK